MTETTWRFRITRRTGDVGEVLAEGSLEEFEAALKAHAVPQEAGDPLAWALQEQTFDVVWWLAEKTS